MQWSELGLETTDGGSLGAGRIGGTALPGGGRHVCDAATGDTVGVVGWAEEDAVDVAVQAARTAMLDWSATDVRERASALRSIAAELRTLAEPLGSLICAESGKRLEEAVAEVGFSARYFDWFADACTRVDDGYYETPQRRFLIGQRPAGVAVAVSPWNFPLSIPARKIAPAIAAGCAVVQKPSELTPLSSLALTAVCERVLPVGLVNVLVGDGAVLTPALVDHSDVRVVSFTGSTQVGRSVAERAGRALTRSVLELGGRAPFIVCDDADVPEAVEALMVAKLRNNGASCLAANNVFVHADVYDEVLDRLREKLETIVIGDPRDPQTGLGPLIQQREVGRLEQVVAEARDSGAKVTTFGSLPDTGSYAPVALVEDPAVESAAWATELFGPVLSVRRFTDEAAVVEEVNGWSTGLGGYVACADPERQINLAQRLDIGVMAVNNGAPNTPEVPFGGRGDSGLGREGGMSGLREFIAEQTVSIAR
ncbi:aldehyde dehydrogenase family protein [Nocardioides coralli]|uniref:aldehyde dehydrogenase family protein n=1 Tax=Nocardioides coralli TaxID=2872154 RepID=UPI001CA39A5F|nr:aldehyde dehydrogenase family protein [Nocardioides coralli]QZY30458.1 aldehyde dehydrogenase family protein [Nocardioides coralli]